MAMTGQDLWLYTQNIIDKDYSDWISTAKANRLFEAALYNLIEQKLAVMDSQKIYDELNSLIKTFTITVSNNIVIKSNDLADYMRLLSIKADIEDKSFAGVFVSSTTISSPIKITLNKKTSLRSGSYIRTTSIVGSSGETAYYVKRISDKVFELYSDKNLTVPSIYVSSTSNPTVGNIFSEYCTPYLSDRKINSLGRPLPFEPAYEDLADEIHIHPKEYNCVNVTGEYISKPSVIVDVADTTIDLELTYPKKFLYALANEFANIFAASTRDAELYRSSETEIVQNP
jgi:hypothetical protein